MYGQNLYNSPNSPFSQNDDKRPLTVTELNSRSRRMLETHFGNIHVIGELSGLARPGSGHWYFTLKDTSAQIRCAMFKNRNKALRFTPKEGMQVLLRGRVSLYEGRGDYQLIVEHMEEAGAGVLQRAFEELKQKLATEGLFDTAKKRPLPAMPEHIGVITSPTGAAIRDILSVLRRRFPAIPVTVIPSTVQGQEAADQLVSALKRANQSQAFDVLIVGRGGGSIEDLWPFNEEKVARAIAASETPVVSAVGHEIDFTIADFVADYRAPTPSAAAEVLSPNRQEWLSRVSLLFRKLQAQTLHRLQLAAQNLDNLGMRLRHPGEKLKEHEQRLQDLTIRLQQAQTLQLERSRARLQQGQGRLQQQAPDRLVSQLQVQAHHLEERLKTLISHQLERHSSQLQQLSGQLHTVSPLATLSRGYSITRKKESIIRNAADLSPGDEVTTRFNQGSASCKVVSISNE